MKLKSVVLYIVLITAAAGSCKKGDSGGSGVPPPPPPEKKVVVSTFAGEGTNGYLDGPLLSAKFSTPSDIAISTDGILYVADYNSRRIRMIKDGQVFLLAGDGNFGTRNGDGDTAQFVDPFRIEVDANGNVYVMDQADARVRRITPGRVVSTYAGASVSGFRDGDVSVALFRQGMGGIAMGTEGAIYIDDTQNGRIRKLSAAGQVSTFAGKATKGFVDGDISVAEFLNPNAILFDKQGNMYVADNGNYCIRKITPAGMVSKFTGVGTTGMTDGGPGVAKFQYINDMVIDKDGNLFICDGDRIRKVTPKGVVSSIAGGDVGYVDGDGATARFNYPAGMAIDGEGNLYIADAMNNRVREVSFK